MKLPKNTSFLKDMLKNNLFDKYMKLEYNIVEKLGLKNLFDAHWFWRGWTYRFILKILWDHKRIGQENFPDYGPGIAISNHQSELDPFLVGGAVTRNIHWVSKIENFNIPIFKSLIKPFGTIPLVRGESDKEAIEKMKSTLESGNWIGIFPEGTRSPDGKLKPFHKGAAKFCIQFGVPYMPFYIEGANKILPKHQPWYKMRFDNKIEVRFGKPVTIASDVKINLKSLEFIRDQMRNDVVTLKGGEINEARIIKQSDIDRGSMEVKKKIIYESSVQIAKRKKKKLQLNPFDVSDDYSIA